MIKTIQIVCLTLKTHFKALSHRRMNHVLHVRIFVFFVAVYPFQGITDSRICRMVLNDKMIDPF